MKRGRERERENSASCRSEEAGGYKLHQESVENSVTSRGDIGREGCLARRLSRRDRFRRKVIEL